MVTLKLKKPGSPDRAAPRTDRAPVRGIGAGASKPRPTVAQAEVQRAEREARYQEQLRQRFGDQPPPAKFVRRDDNGPGRPRQDGPPRREAPPRGPGDRNAGGFDRPRPRPEGDPRGQSRGDPRGDSRSDARGDFRGDPRGHDRRPPRAADDRRPPARFDDRPNNAFERRPDDRRPPAGGPPARQDQRRNSGPRDEPRGEREPYRGSRDDGRYSGIQARPDGRPDPRFDSPRPGTRDDGRGMPRSRDDAAPARARRDAPPQGANTAFGRPNPKDDHRDDRSPAPVRRREPAEAAPQDGDTTMRLSKRMSELGIASRREADEWIPKGWVRVDGRVVTELGSRVLPGQHITIDAKARNQQSARVTVLINKPVGYVSGQAEDGYEPAYVLVTPDNQWREDRSGIRFQMSHLRSLAPAGRLDIDSVGLLVLTQDGRVAKQLIGEDSDVEKEYLVRVRTTSGDALPQTAMDLLRHGLSLDGVELRPADVEWVNDDQLRFVLREGRKRQIRRMCEAVGLEVLGLKRVRIGTVMLGDLPAGQWRYLRYDERFAELQAGEVAELAAAQARAAAEAAADDDVPEGVSEEAPAVGDADVTDVTDVTSDGTDGPTDKRED